MHTAPPTDRRATARLPLELPAKVQSLSDGRYAAGQTVNASSHGLLLRLDTVSPLPPGLRVRVAVADHPQQAVLRAHAMVPATVVRSLGLDGLRHVAVRLDQPTCLSRAG